MQKLHN
jgi:hypothetical protein